MTALDSLRQLLPDIQFAVGDTFCWSPKSRQITYPAEALAYDDGNWALLHEAGHAFLRHQTFASDFELLTMEVAAWEKAKELGKSLGISIDSDHIQDCLDTYREWLHRRSTCPTCGSSSLQHPNTSYACYNCHAEWQVTPSRFCRPYRLLKRSNEVAATKATPAAIFQ